MSINTHFICLKVGDLYILLASGRIDAIAEKLDSLEDERADKRQLQMSIQRRFEKYKNLLIRFFENEVGDDEKRMIILKLFEKITVSRGTENTLSIL